MRTFRFVIWLLKIMVLPITATTLVLWGVVVYLLKNSELLEAQRNKPEANEPPPEDQEENLDGKVTFTALPRGFENDVRLIASSTDGRAVVFVGTRNELVVWSNSRSLEIDTSDVLHRTASTSSTPSTLTAVAVSADGKFCAVGTAAGIIAIWALNGGNVQPYPFYALDDSSNARVTDIQFMGHSLPSTSAPVSRVSSPSDADVLVAVYENGLAAKWVVQELGSCTMLPPQRQARVVKASLTRVQRHHGSSHLLIAFALEDGSLELYDPYDTPSLLNSRCIALPNYAGDAPSLVHGSEVHIEGENRLVIAVATGSGAVSLWDCTTNESVHTFDDRFGSVNRLRLTPMRCEKCHFCGLLPPHSFSLTISVGNNIFFYVASFKDEAQRCSCHLSMPTNKAATWESVGRRSRSNSANGSPLMGRNTRTLDLPEFPISGHGIHSRKSSEKENMPRRDSLFVPIPDELEISHMAGPSSALAVSEPWCRLAISRVGDATCERGEWDVVNGNIVGVRRRSRALGKPSNGHAPIHHPSSTSGGLSTNTLGRWELWLFDPSSLRLRISALSSLLSVDEDAKEDKIPRLPFTRVTPFISAGSRGLAGFGNTLGVFRFISS
jgi:WD40 repeat protein